MIKNLKKSLPIYNSLSKKGENGKLCIIGGSEEYVGAPYFSNYSSFYCGNELNTIITHEDSALPLKTLCPDSIVLSLLPIFNNSNDLYKNLKHWIGIHELILIGPGLGRDKSLNTNIFNILDLFKSKNVIMDADMLWLLQYNENKIGILEYLNLINLLVLTPNFTEFNRLYKKFINDDEIKLKELYIEIENFIGNNIIIKFNIENLPKKFINLFKILLFTKYFKENKINIYTFWKSKYDIITNGYDLYIINFKGSEKRCGGIGDILAGSIGATLNYSKNLENIFEKLILSSIIVRYCSNKAFEKYKISLTSNLIIKEMKYTVSEIVEIINNEQL